MQTLTNLLFCAMAINAGLSAASARPVPVPTDEALTWVRHTVPLPKQIEITGKRIMSASQIMVLLSGSTEPLAIHAVRELREAVGKQLKKGTLPKLGSVCQRRSESGVDLPV